MTTTPTAVGVEDDGVSVSQSGSAHGAPSGSEPSAAVREAALRIIDPAAVNPGYRRNNETEAHWLARKQRRITAALKKADAVLALATSAGRADLLERLTEITVACEEDCGIPDDGDEDDEAVGSGMEGPMALTFGMLRRARAAIEKALRASPASHNHSEGEDR